MESKLFKEAIADAKVIRETAIANAKAALEESFSPHLKEILAQKLQEMEEMDEEMDLDEVTEAKDEMEEGTEEVTEAKDEMEEGTEEVTEAKDEMEEGKMEEMDEEMDLDELLREIEEDDSKTESEESEMEVEDDEVETDVEDKVSEDEEEFDLEDMSEEDLVAFIEDVIKEMVAGGEIALDSISDAEETESEEGKEEEAEEEMIDEMKEKEIKELKSRYSQQEAQNAILTNQLKEATKAVKVLKNELNEINLLNAKLLYSNRIFKSKNLTESQKVKVLDTFDKAATINEVKLVYQTMDEGLKTTQKRPIKENILPGASKTILSSGTQSKSSNIIEADTMVSRFQKLAGII